MVFEVLYKLGFIIVALKYIYEINIYVVAGKRVASKRNKVLQGGNVEKKESAENANIRGITCLKNYNSYCMYSE